MSTTNILTFGDKIEVKDKGEYVLIYISGLPYKIPKDKYEKMKIGKNS